MVMKPCIFWSYSERLLIESKYFERLCSFFKDIYCLENVYSLFTTRYRFWKIKRWDREEERALDTSITEWDRYVGRAEPGIIFMNCLFLANHSFSYRQLSDVCSSRTMGPIVTKFDNNWVTGIQVYSIEWSCPVKMCWRILKFFSTMIQTNSAQIILGLRGFNFCFQMKEHSVFKRQIRTVFHLFPNMLIFTILTITLLKLVYC